MTLSMASQWKRKVGTGRKPHGRNEKERARAGEREWVWGGGERERSLIHTSYSRRSALKEDDPRGLRGKYASRLQTYIPNTLDHHAFLSQDEHKTPAT
jgi:hypothetical protein